MGESGTATVPRSDPANDRQPWQFTTDEEHAYTARVAIDASHAQWAQHHLSDARVVVAHDDGSIEIELEITNVAAFRSLVLSMLDAAEVLAPESLRVDMVEWLESMAAT